MKIIIVEDERLAVDRLQSMLDSIQQVEVAAVLDTVKKAVAYLKAAPPVDLIFMDIQLGDGKSFEILDRVEVASPVIFITAFDEYAIKAFKYNSIDYLVKPLIKTDLEFALEKYRKQQKKTFDYKGLSALLNNFSLEEKETKTRFLVKKGSRFLSVNVADVAFAYTKERLHFIKTFSDVDYLIDTNLDDLELQLDEKQFYRVNRQFIVSHKAIQLVETWFDGKLRLSTQPAPYEDIVISRLRSQSFKRWLDK